MITKLNNLTYCKIMCYVISFVKHYRWIHEMNGQFLVLDVFGIETNLDDDSVESTDLDFSPRL